MPAAPSGRAEGQMPSDSACPDAATLRQLALGQLTGPDAERLQEHLASCPNCAATLAHTACSVESESRTAPLAGDPRFPVDLSVSESSAQTPSSVGQSTTAGIAAQPAHAQPAAHEPSLTGESGDDGLDPLSTAPLGEGGVSAAEIPFDFLAPPQEPSEIGRLGPYRVLKVLGAGGMGVVFQAEDTALKRLVALKVMRPTMALSTRARKRFLREAQATAQLTHDHIVRIHKVDEDRGVLFLAMQLLQGETLRERLKREQKLPMAEVLSIGRQIADGLAAAHERGLIHRDVKPGNIWLEQEHGRVTILDFGLVRPLDADARISHSGMIAGTPQYMAPEQAEGGAVGPRADLFSLGCILYRMATGSVPFQGNTVMAILRSLALEEPKDPRLLNPEVPAKLADLIMRLLAKQPQQRPESAQEVRSALEALERQEKATRAAAQADAAPATGRRVWPWVTAVAALAAIVAATMYFLPPRPPSPASLQFESDEPLALIHVQGQGKEYLLSDLPQSKTIEVEPGNYEVQLLDAPPGLELSARQISVRAGESKTIEIRRKEDTVTAADSLRAGAIPAMRLLAAGKDDALKAPTHLVAVLGSGRAPNLDLLWEHTDKAEFFALNPTGESLAVFTGARNVSSADGTRFKTVFDYPVLLPASGGKPLGDLKRTMLSQIAFDAKGELKGMATRGTSVLVFDLKTFKGSRELKAAAPVGEVVASPDGSLLVTAAGRGVQVWDLVSAAQKFSLTGHEQDVTKVNFSLNSQFLVTVSGDGVAKIWNLTNGKEAAAFRQEDTVTAAALSGDGRLLATAGKATGLRVWDVATKNLVHERGLLSPEVRQIDFHPDGKKLVLVRGGGRATAKAELSDFAADVTWQVPGRRGVLQARFSDDGKRLFTSGQQGLQVWRLSAQREGHDGAALCLAVKPDGRLCASGGQDRTVCLWDLAGGNLHATLSGHDAPVTAVAFSPDGGFLAAATEKGSIKLWDVTTRKEMRTFAAASAEDRIGAVRCLAFSSEGKTLAAAGADGKVRLWNTGRGQWLCSFEPGAGPINAVVFHRQGKWLLSAGADGNVRVWNLSSGQVERTLAGHGKAVTALSFRRDGRLLASAGEDGAIKLWDFPSGNERMILRAPHVAVRAVAFRLDGKLLASAHDDATLHWWDAASGAWAENGLALFPGDERARGGMRAVSALAVTPEGRHLITANSDGTLFVLRLQPLDLSTATLAQHAAQAPFLPGEDQQLQEKWAALLKREVMETNSLGMKLALIPPGAFAMAPGYQVRLTSPYLLSTCEVTIGEFRKFVVETNHQTSVEKSGEGGYVWSQGKWIQDKGNTWKKLAEGLSDRHPVTLVSREDAEKFCAWLSAKEKRTYRLPTEAEWVWACAAGATTRFHFGSSPDRLDDYAWHAGNARAVLHPVGLLKPNRWGLFDLYGNVRELCRDSYAALPMGRFSNPVGPSTPGKAVLRGGGILSQVTSGSFSRAAADAIPTSHDGFRIVLEIAEQGISKFEGTLAATDALDRVRADAYHKVHGVTLRAGIRYRIDLISPDYDTYLRIEDAAGKELDSDDDGGEGLNSRLYFVAPATGEYRIISTSFGEMVTGRYTLTIREALATEVVNPPGILPAPKKSR